MMVSGRHAENRLPSSSTAMMDTVQEETREGASSTTPASSSAFSETASRLCFDDRNENGVEEGNNDNGNDKIDRRATIDGTAQRNHSNSSTRRRSSPFFRNASPSRSMTQRKSRMSSPFRRRQQQPSSTTTRHHHSMSGMEIATGGRGCIGNGATHVSMEEYVRKSSRVQSFIGSAWQQAKNATNQRHSQEPSSSKKQTPKKRRRDRASSTGSGGDDDMSIASTNTESRQGGGGGSETVVDDGSSQKLLEEQTTEIWRLKQELEEMQRQHQTLQTKHDSLKQELTSSQEETARAKVAERMARDGVNQARDDAEAAETSCLNMAQQLQDLQTVVTETKKASQLLQQEHEHVERQVAQAEITLVHKGEELVRLRESLKERKAQQELFDAMKQRWHHQQETLQRQLSEQTKLVEQLERSNHDTHRLASARLERLQSLQEDWNTLQAQLEEETQSKLETQQAMMKLSDSVATLQKANDELHKKLTTQQEEHHESNMEQQDALNQSAEEALQLRIEMERLQEQVQKLEVTGRQNDKNKTPNSILPPLVPKKAVDVPSNVEKENGNENQENVLASNGGKKNSKCCSCCNRDAFGLMKRCQCGDPSCQKRAHLSCAQKIKSSFSVSYPGTPAPQLPLVLCGSQIPGVGTGRPSSSSSSSSNKQPLGAANSVNTARIRASLV